MENIETRKWNDKDKEQSLKMINDIINSFHVEFFNDILKNIERIIKDINFEHNNCIVSYKDDISLIKKEMKDIEKELMELPNELNNKTLEYSESYKVDISHLNNLYEVYKKKLTEQQETIPIEENQRIEDPFEEIAQARKRLKEIAMQIEENFQKNRKNDWNATEEFLAMEDAPKDPISIIEPIESKQETDKITELEESLKKKYQEEPIEELLPYYTFEI